MNYLRNIFTKKKNEDAFVIANDLFYGNMELNNGNIESLIKKNRIPVKMNASLKKDIEDQYYRLVEKDENTERQNEDKRALEEIITRNNVPVSANLAKQLAFPVSAPKKISMSASDEDEWVTSSSSIEGGMKKRRKTKSKSRKSKKTRKHRKKKV
jgi:hypothetical protein